MTEGVTSVGVLTTDQDLVVRSWDAWLVEATGVTALRACGTFLGDLFPEIVERGFVPRLRRVAEQGAVEVLAPAFHRYFVPCAPRAPSEHFDRMQQHVTFSPLRVAGQIAGVVITIEDVTPRLERMRALTAELESQDEAIRLRATRALASSDAQPDTFSGVLGDPSWRVRRAAASALARGGEDAVAALVATIRERHRDPATLNAAIAALAETASDAVPAVLALLRADDAEVRTYAALTLGILADVRAVPALLDALDDADQNVRYHAIEALGRVRSRVAADRLAAVAASGDFHLAFPALDALASIGEPAVAPRLLPLLEDPLLQAAAAEALGRLGSEDVTVPLAQLLARDDADVAAIAVALATLYERLESGYGEGELVADRARLTVDVAAVARLVDALTRAADHELPPLVRVLGWMHADGVDRALTRMLEHPLARPVALDALAGRGASAVDPLLDALESDAEPVRRAAAAALGRIASARAVPALIRRLDDTPDVVVVAAGALGAIGNGAALDPLLALLDHPAAAVRQAAVAALNSLGHPDLRDRAAARLSSPSAHVRESAARIVGYFGYRECVGPLVALAHDPDESVRRVAIEQMGFLEDPAATAAVADALRDPAPTVRAAAARSLAQLPAAEAVPQLLFACADSDHWVRYYAVRSAAAHLDAALTRVVLDIAAHDPSPPVRLAAVRVLGERAVAEGLPLLLQLATDVEDEMAGPAIEALGMLGRPDALPVLIATLDSPSAARRRIALEALARLRADGSVVAVDRAARLDPDPGARAAAVDALRAIGTASSVAALVSQTAEPRHAAAATSALAALGAAQVPLVARGLQHPDVGVRCAVVEALGRMRDRAASRALAEALEDRVAAVRAAAAQALGRLDARDAQQKLASLAITDESPAVRQAAHGAVTR